MGHGRGRGCSAVLASSVLATGARPPVVGVRDARALARALGRGVAVGHGRAPRRWPRGPGARSSTGMVHGGTTWMRLKWENGQTPFALQAATTSFIGAAASPAALNGTSGSRVSRSRTSSMAQNTPRPRTSPTDGWRSCSSRSAGPITSVPSVRACSSDALLLEDGDRGDGRRAGQRVARVGEPAGVRPLLERVGDGPADDHATERDVARVDALGEADEVGRDVPVVDREPLAAAAEAGHHLVADHHDAVPVAQLPHALRGSRGAARGCRSCRPRSRA